MQTGNVGFRENEFQRLLADERTRCDQYKLIYQTLKEQHQRLQDELTIIHQQLKEAVEQNETLKNANDSYVRKLEETLKSKENEVNVLQGKVSSFDVDALRTEILKETTEINKLKIKKAQEDADDQRAKYTELYFKHNQLKCEAEISETQLKNNMEVLKANHKREIFTLESKITDLENDKPIYVKDFSSDLKAAEEEIAILRSKLKTTQAEYQELHAQKEKESVQYDCNAQNQEKQLATFANRIKALENENAALTSQKDLKDNTLQQSQSERIKLSSELQKRMHEIGDLKTKISRLEYEYNLIESKTKQEMQKLKIDFENEKKIWENEIEKLRQQILQCEIESRDLVLKQESFYDHQITALKEEAFKKYQEIQHALSVANEYIENLEKTHKQEQHDYHKKLVTVKEEMQNVLLTKNKLESELIKIKAKLEDQSEIKASSSNYEKLLQQNAEFHREIENLKSQIAQLRTSEHNVEYNRNYNPPLLPQPAQTSANIDQNEYVDLKVSFEQRKYEYQSRIDHLETIIKEKNDSWEKERESILAKQKQYARLITKLRNRIDSQKLKLEEVESLNEILKTNVPLEDHLNVKSKLMDLRRKQEEFHQVMLTASEFAPVENKETWRLEGSLFTGSKIDMTLPKQIAGNSIHSDTSLRSIRSRKNLSQARSSKTLHKTKKKLKSTSRSQSVHLSSSSDIENL